MAEDEGQRVPVGFEANLGPGCTVRSERHRGHIEFARSTLSVRAGYDGLARPAERSLPAAHGVEAG